VLIGHLRPRARTREAAVHGELATHLIRFTARAAAGRTWSASAAVAAAAPAWRRTGFAAPARRRSRPTGGRSRGRQATGLERRRSAPPAACSGTARHAGWVCAALVAIPTRASPPCSTGCRRRPCMRGPPVRHAGSHTRRWDLGGGHCCLRIRWASSTSCRPVWWLPSGLPWKSEPQPTADPRRRRVHSEGPGPGRGGPGRGRGLGATHQTDRHRAEQGG